MVRQRRVSLRVNPDVDPGTHPYISTGLKGNKFGIAPSHAWRRMYKQQVCRAFRWSESIAHRISDHRDAPYLDALDRVLDLVKPSGHTTFHSPSRPGRRTGLAYADEVPPVGASRFGQIHCWLALSARHGHRKILLSPGARWSATQAS